MGRTIVFGDLQGCYDEACDLLELLEVKADDWVIFAGDLADRGPDSGKCVDLAILREKIQGKPAAILGNHENKHLKYRTIEESGQQVGNIPPSHVATRMQLTAEHYEYFKRLPLFLRIPEHNAAVVHAGVFPGRTLEEQKKDHLLHIQMIKPYDFDHWGNLKTDERTTWPSKVKESELGQWRFWTEYWDGPERIVFGHSVLDKPLLNERVRGVDGGCCFGRELWAVVMTPGSKEWNVVRTPARHPEAQNNRIKKFWVSGDVCTYS